MVLSTVICLNWSQMSHMTGLNRSRVHQKKTLTPRELFFKSQKELQFRKSDDRAFHFSFLQLYISL